MTDRSKQTPEMDVELDAMFAQAQAEAPIPSADLLGRIADDAHTTQGSWQEAPRPIADEGAWWRRMFYEMGGVPAMGGLLASAVAGVYLGFANPDIASGLAGYQYLSESDFSVQSDALMSDPLLGDLVWMTEG